MLDSQYRELIIETVTQHDDSLTMSFRNCIVSLQSNRQWLKDRYVNPKELVSGRHILIKGNVGNEDVSLACPDALENLVLMPMID